MNQSIRGFQSQLRSLVANFFINFLGQFIVKFISKLLFHHLENGVDVKFSHSRFLLLMLQFNFGLLSMDNFVMSRFVSRDLIFNLSKFFCLELFVLIRELLFKLAANFREFLFKLAQLFFKSHIKFAEIELLFRSAVTN